MRCGGSAAVNSADATDEADPMRARMNADGCTIDDDESVSHAQLQVRLDVRAM
jgi:hypothetical protein